MACALAWARLDLALLAGAAAAVCSIPLAAGASRGRPRPGGPVWESLVLLTSAMAALALLGTWAAVLGLR